MLLHIVARGRIGQGPEAMLMERYLKRISWPIKITEEPDRGSKALSIRAQSAQSMRRILLDEAGEGLSSLDFAHLLEKWRTDGVREVRFCLGAADGFTAEEHRTADKIIAFGRTTWPHLLARAMLAEQLYRATSILAGHPYHRGNRG